MRDKRETTGRPRPTREAGRGIGLTVVGRMPVPRKPTSRMRAQRIVPGPVRGASPDMFLALVDAIRDVACQAPRPLEFLEGAQGAVREALLLLARLPDGSPDERQMRLIDANFDAAVAVVEAELRVLGG